MAINHLAKYIRRLEGYTDEELEVLEYKVNIRDELKVNLVCRHPLSGQKVRYRMHTDPEGIVIRVEREDKTKSKTVWETLSPKITHKTSSTQKTDPANKPSSTPT